MAYHTVSYLFVFLPLVLCLYQFAPGKARWLVLLLAGYAFLWTFDGRMALWLAASSLFTHYICVLITLAREKQASVPVREKQVSIPAHEKSTSVPVREKQASIPAHEKTESVPAREKQVSECKKILVFGIMTLLCLLGYVKYSGFFADNLNRISAVTGILPELDPGKRLIPLGISFYTLQAIGYMVDVYRGRAEVSTNPGKTALFLGFFPQIMEGPICSYGQTTESLWKGAPIRAANLSEGCVRILWGLFKKMIIADRLNVLVGKIFDNYTEYGGAMIAAAAAAYTIQLYLEFSGCMDIVIGSGRLFGIILPENFRQPFFAVDAADFWRRWHISLGVWFRTYVFFPVSVSAPVKRWSRFAKARFGKSAAKTGTLALALFPVWLCNGLWHGPRWSYIFYGMYYFTVLLLTAIFDPLRDKTLKRLHISKEAVWYKAIRIVKTWVIIIVGELFFRAEGLRNGIEMFRRILQGVSIEQLQGDVWLKLGLDQADYLAVIVGCMIVMVVGIIKEKRGSVIICLQKTYLPIRWAVYYGLIFAVIIFGAYGVGYQKVDLIYAGF